MQVSTDCDPVTATSSTTRPSLSLVPAAQALSSATGVATCRVMLVLELLLLNKSSFHQDFLFFFRHDRFPLYIFLLFLRISLRKIAYIIYLFVGVSLIHSPSLTHQTQVYMVIKCSFVIKYPNRLIYAFIHLQCIQILL